MSAQQAAVAAPFLELLDIGKTYPGVVALSGVELSVAAGEIIGLVGENGAGKSTLMKILGGVAAPSKGTIRIDGTERAAMTVADATKAGIAFVHQELNLFDNLDVAANVFIGREPRYGGPLGLIDTQTLHQKVTPLLRRLGADFGPATPVANLSLAQRQLVEIAKALSLDARLVIMDEPTSSLTASETARLLGVIADLKANNVSIIFISHRLQEVEHCADRVIVLRDGKVVGRLGRGQIQHDAMIRLMIGRDLKSLYIPPAAPPRETALDLAEVRTTAFPGQSVTLALRKGEILGLAGLVGSGRTELARAIFGIDRRLGGRIVLSGQPLEITEPRDAIDRGLYLIPEDRKQCGLLLDFSVAENISLANLRAYSQAMIVQGDAEASNAERQKTKLNIKVPSVATQTSSLSGGNQQKVVLAKWLSMSPKVIIFDEPTRGIDVGAKGEIYELMRVLADSGVAILMISSDMEEVIGVSDRIAVMHEGRIGGFLERDEFSENRVLQLAVGKSPQEAAAIKMVMGGIMPAMFKKDLSLLVLILVVGTVVAIINPRFLSPINIANTANLIGLFGMFSIGMGFVIITGGIELSVGSIFALLGVIFIDLLVTHEMAWPIAVVLIIVAGTCLGWLHGFLVTKAKLQPFVVTLCGLLIYRGIARYYTDDGTAGFEFGMNFPALEWLTTGRAFGLIPHSFIVFILLAIVLGIVLHKSVFGRYLFAVGKNEEAARYSGIRTDRIITAAYVISGALCGLSAIYLAMYTRSISPASHGSFYELYAIAAAVLGGCSLRGGEGSVLGIVLGAILLQVLQNLVNLLGIPSSLNFAVIGGVILIGVLADQQLVRRRQARLAKK